MDPSSSESSDSAEPAPDGVAPLDRFFMREPDAKRQEREAERERSIVECMAAAGFEYLPVIDHTFDRLDEETAVRSTRAWVEAHGYGFADMFTQPYVPEPDPNNARLAGMTAAKRERFWAALDGPVPPLEQPDPGWAQSIPEEGAPEPAPDPDPIEAEHSQRQMRQVLGAQGEESAPVVGCRNIAVDAENKQQEAERGDPPTQADYDRFDGLVAQIEAMYKAADQAPELADLAQEWRTCMAAAGYSDFEFPSDASDSMMRRWGTLSGQEPQERSYRPMGMIFMSPSQIPAAKAKALRAEEVSLALADFDCKVPYRGPAMKVLRQYETDFVAEHQAELEAYQALYSY